MIKIRIKQFFVTLFFYLIPPTIIVWRHVDLTIEQTTSIMPFVLVGVIFAVFLYFKMKKRNEIMIIRRTKEIEDNARTVGTILYFYSKFAVVFVIVFILLYYVQFNFKSLTGTMEWIALSLVLGALLRINLAQTSGY